MKLTSTTHRVPATSLSLVRPMASRTLSISILGFCLATASGCSGGGGGPAGNDSPSPNAPPSASEGLFLDSAVQGLAYETPTEAGVTNARGAFLYRTGETVQFAIGDIVFGAVPAQEIVTPVDLAPGASDETDPTVINIARFLQTCDDDGDPADGIVITDALAALATGMTIDFNQPVAQFEDNGAVQTAISVLTSVTTAGSRMLVSADDASGHLRGTLLDLLSGAYSGTFSGTDSGTFSIEISSDGRITGSATSNLDGSTVTVAGSISSSGDFTAIAGQASDGTTFSGVIGRDGTLNGTWANAALGESGTFVGARGSSGSSGPPPSTPPPVGSSGVTLIVTELGGGTVGVSWSIGSDLIAQGANDFTLEFYVGGGIRWQPQVSTSEPTDGGLPIVLGGVPESYCFRMTATVAGSSTILASGLAGNSPPCTGS